jgi:intracellular septation protein A
MTTTQNSTQPNGHTKPKNPAATALRPLILDVAIPLGSYYLMRHFGVAVVPALAVSSIVPAADGIIGLIRDRVVNGLALLMVAVNVVGIAVTLWSGNARLMLAKEAAVSSTIGIALLISAFAGRPGRTR